MARDHLAHHTHGGEQAWLAEGRRIQRDNDCPYCGQSTAGIPLVRAYEVLFGEAYGRLRQRLADTQAQVNRTLGASALAALQAVVGHNDRLNEFWRGLVDQAARDEALAGDLRAAANEWHAAADELLASKLAAPLELCEVSLRFIAARNNWERLQPRVIAYNEAVAAINRAIDAFKARAPAADLAAARRDLETLRNAERRHDAATTSVIEAFRRVETEKNRLEREKTEAKAALDAYSGQVLDSTKAASMNC